MSKYLYTDSRQRPRVPLASYTAIFALTADSNLLSAACDVNGVDGVVDNDESVMAISSCCSRVSVLVVSLSASVPCAASSASPTAARDSSGVFTVLRRVYSSCTNFLMTAFDGTENSSVAVERALVLCRYARTPACTARRSVSRSSIALASVFASSELCLHSSTRQKFRL